MALGRFAPKPCRRIGRERRLCRAKAVRTNRTGAKALSGQSRADESGGSEGFAVSKPCGRWLWLGSRQSRADERTGAKALSCQSRADERTGQEAEAKMALS